jgi:hypothetical protein
MSLILCEDLVERVTIPLSLQTRESKTEELSLVTYGRAKAQICN